MHPVNLIARSIKNISESVILPEHPIDGICALTGDFTKCIHRKHLLSKSFTNNDLLARPISLMISVDAYIALKYPAERMSSWFCDGITFEKLNRQGVRIKVFQKQMPIQWIGYATTSYKKHGSLNTKVNSRDQRIWLFETRQIDCTDMHKVREWWGKLNEALRAGIGRDIIESLECSSFVMKKIGLLRWMDFEQWARDKYLSALYAFLVYLLPSQEELKNGYK